MQKKTSDRPLVSIVAPGFNESAIVEKNLGLLCDYMETIENDYQWELIFINDGSTDDTGQIAEDFAKQKDNVHILHHPYNFRLGQALRCAFSNCSGDYVVVMDLDLSYAPAHIGKMLKKIIESRAKIVIASPYMNGGKVSNVPWLRKKLSVWANRFLSLVLTKDTFSDRLTTLTGMVRTYDNRLLSRLVLRAMDVDIHTEIIYKAMILRARIVEIPAYLDWGPLRDFGKKRSSSMRMVKSIISNLLSGFILRPFMFFIMPGMALLLLALYPLIWICIHTYIHYQNIAVSVTNIDYKFSSAVGTVFDHSPHAFIVGGFALLAGIQLVGLGMQALQSKRYFEELFFQGSQTYSDKFKSENNQCEYEKTDRLRNL